MKIDGEIRIAIIKIKEAFDNFPIIKIDPRVESKEARVIKKGIRSEMADLRYSFEQGLKRYL